jgi:hypothetical protein
MSCTTCHGTPPAAPHVQSTACGSCHAGYTSTSANDATHRNGRVDVAAMSCTSCHGSPPPAPHPASTACGACHTGFSATTANTAIHRNGQVNVAQSCNTCHGTPPSSGQHDKSAHRRACGDCHGTGYTATSTVRGLHVNGTLNVGGTLVSGWNPSTTTCTNACHGSRSWYDGGSGGGWGGSGGGWSGSGGGWGR